MNSGQGVGSGSTGVLEWSFAPSSTTGSPVIGADGTIYACTSSATYAMGPTGAQKWYATVGSVASPAIGADGAVYVCAGKVFALSGSTGAQKWSFATGEPGSSFSAPAIGSDGTIYAGTQTNGAFIGRVYALNGSTGTQKWSFPAGSVEFCPAIGSDGTVYVGAVYSPSEGGGIFALDGATGTEKWSASGLTATSSAAIGADGTVYIGGLDAATMAYSLYALDGATGTEKWAYPTTGATSTPAISSDGTIYTCSGGKVLALDPVGGTEKWTSSGSSAPTIASDGTVYVGYVDQLLALNGSTGAQKWSFQATGSPSSSPAIGSDGTLYLGWSSGTYNGFYGMYALGSGALTGLSLTASVVEGGTAGFGTVTIAAPATTTAYVHVGGTDVQPQYVAIPVGAMSANFSFATAIVSSPVTAKVTAVLGSTKQMQTLTIEPAPIASLSIPSPASVLRTTAPSLEGGISTSGTVSLGGPTGENGDVVTLASNNSALTVPASVTVAKGLFSVEFAISTASVTSVQSATVTATLGSSTVQAVVSIYPYAPISSFWVSPSSVMGGAVTRGAVILSGKAPTGGSLIAIASSSPDITVPAAIRIAAGNWEGSFAISTKPVSNPETITLTATLGASSMQTTLELDPYLAINDLYASPSVIIAGSSTHGVVQLGEPAGSEGEVITLSSKNSAVSVPATVNVPSGSTGVSFPISTAQVAAANSVELTATLGSSSQTATLTLFPNAIINFYISSTPTSYILNGVIQLAGPAPAGGANVKLSEVGPGVLMPSSVTVPSGKSGVSFSINIKGGESNGFSTDASYGGSQLSMAWSLYG